jgi:hypothetical protein
VDDPLPGDDGVAVHLRSSRAAAAVGDDAIALEDAELAGDQAGHPPIGWILMIVGIVGGVISMVFWQSWAGPGYLTRRRTVVDEPPAPG